MTLVYMTNKKKITCSGKYFSSTAKVKNTKKLLRLPTIKKYRSIYF